MTTRNVLLKQSRMSSKVMAILNLEKCASDFPKFIQMSSKKKCK